MKLLKGVKNGVNISIQMLTRIWGVYGDIYLPIKYNDESRGFISNDITYRDEPDYSQKILFPYLFKERNKTMGMIDEFFEDDLVLYLSTTDNTLVKYSKVVFGVEYGNMSFIIKDITEITDDNQILLRKAFLIPDMKIDNQSKEFVEERLELLEEYNEESREDRTDDGDELNMPTNDSYLMYKYNQDTEEKELKEEIKETNTEISQEDYKEENKKLENVKNLKRGKKIILDPVL